MLEGFYGTSRGVSGYSSGSKGVLGSFKKVLRSFRGIRGFKVIIGVFREVLEKFQWGLQRGSDTKCTSNFQSNFPQKTPLTLL